MRIKFTRHALERAEQRKIDRQSIEAVLENPDWTEPDPIDPALTRAYGCSGSGPSVLRVVFRVTEDYRAARRKNEQAEE